MTKQEVRRIVRERQRNVGFDWIANSSAVVQRSVLALAEFASAKVVGCYMAMPVEVQTDAVIDECRTTGKVVCVPAFCNENNLYRMMVLNEDVPLVPGVMGILEPERGEWLEIDDIDLMLVPGLGFDMYGGRVGHGGGHYDKMMSSVDVSLWKVGMAFEFQMFNSLIMDDNDIRMDIVLTEIER